MRGTIVIELQGEDQFELEERVTKYEKIFRLLIDKGGLDGVRGGSTNIHFDGSGVFQGIELSYWPYRVRKSSTLDRND